MVRLGIFSLHLGGGPAVARMPHARMLPSKQIRTVIMGFDTHSRAGLRSTAFRAHDRAPLLLLLCLLLLAGAWTLKAQTTDQLAAAAAQARESNDLPRALALYHQAV